MVRKKKKELKLEPGDLIVSLDDEEVGILKERVQRDGLLVGTTPQKWAWIIQWVKGGERARSIWGFVDQSEEDLIEDIKSGYWILYRG
jgi:hypothetical protein